MAALGSSKELRECPLGVSASPFLVVVAVVLLCCCWGCCVMVMNVSCFVRPCGGRKAEREERTLSLPMMSLTSFVGLVRVEGSRCDSFPPQQEGRGTTEFTLPVRCEADGLVQLTISSCCTTRQETSRQRWVVHRVSVGGGCSMKDRPFLTSPPEVQNKLLVRATVL